MPSPTIRKREHSTPISRPAPRWTSLYRCVSALLIMLMIVTGCSTAKPANFIGTMRVAGDHVTVNGRPADDETDIFSGDDVATGPASSALVEFQDGGIVQLDENTDPSWRHTATGPDQCSLAMSMQYGQFYAETKKCALDVDLNALRSQADTRFNLEARNPSLSTLSVLDGRVAVAATQPVVVGEAEQAQIAGNHVVHTAPLSKAQMDAAVAWRSKYSFSSSGGGWKTALTIVAAVAIIGLIVWGIVAATSGGKHNKSKPPPPSDTTPTRPTGDQSPSRSRPPVSTAPIGDAPGRHLPKTDTPVVN